jgi:hypothetical protein
MYREKTENPVFSIARTRCRKLHFAIDRVVGSEDKAMPPNRSRGAIYRALAPL